MNLSVEGFYFKLKKEKNTKKLSIVYIKPQISYVGNNKPDEKYSQKNIKETANQKLIKLIRKILRFPNGYVDEGHKQKCLKDRKRGD